MHGATQRRVLRDVVADDDQLQMIETRLPDQMERVEQPLDVLVRLDVADVQRELALELIALLDGAHLVLRRRGREPLVDAVVDDGDLLGRDVEEFEDVALRRFRNGQDAVGSSAAAPICARAYASAPRFGRYCGKRR